MSQHKRPSRADLLRRRAELLEEQARVDRELADLESESQSGELDRYGSRAPLPPCPGHSHRWSRDHIPSMPGATRSGGRRGRGVMWTISREAYEAWLASRSTKVDERDPKPSNIVHVDDWIAAAGYRTTRGHR